MDDAGDRQYSRAPELEDLASLCKALNDHRVRYVLIGGFAVILHGYVRATKDIDFLVDPSEENIAALKQAMSYLPDNAAELIANDDVSTYQVVRIADEIVVDLLASACGIDYERAVGSGIEVRDIGGVEVPVASKQLLIETKQTMRPSDAADVLFLRMRIVADENS
ncbi:MAG: DUF6036 family nucleotidyltransferase [Acidobacteriota bacterium]